MRDEFYSHTQLIPVVAAYMAWVRRGSFPARQPPSWPQVGLWAGIGLLGLVGYGVAVSRGTLPHSGEAVGWSILSFVSFTVASVAWAVGPAAVRAAVFPLGFLFIMVPPPPAAMHGLETWLQHTSADVVAVFFQVAGVENVRDGLLFHLKNITLEVAPECSGIRSTLFLEVLSLFTGYFFLKSAAHRTLLAVAAPLLGVVRNGFRILVIGWLCVHYGPEMSESAVHRKGGPYFFAISLLPFALLVYLLVRRERRSRPRLPAAAAAA